MHPYVKQEWVKALRSGRYKQGHGELRRGDRFCCLGVLCDLDARHRQIGFTSLSPVGSIGLLPQGMSSRFGVSTRTQLALAELNDISRWSFDQIADHIEKNL